VTLPLALSRSAQPAWWDRISAWFRPQPHDRRCQILRRGSSQHASIKSPTRTSGASVVASCPRQHRSLVPDLFRKKPRSKKRQNGGRKLHGLVDRHLALLFAISGVGRLIIRGQSPIIHPVVAGRGLGRHRRPSAIDDIQKRSSRLAASICEGWIIIVFGAWFARCSFKQGSRRA